MITLDNSKSKIIFFNNTNNTNNKLKKCKDKRPTFVKYGLNCPM